MRLALPVLLCVLAGGAARADEAGVPVEFVAATDLPPQAKPAKGPKGEPGVEVVGGEKASKTTILLRDNPPISSHDFAVRGWVKYEGIEGHGYLDLWSDFGDRGTFLYRTLAKSGLQGRLTHSHDWRPFELPFHGVAAMRLRQIRLDVVLPGAGVVTVAGARVESIDRSRQWWNEQRAGLLGGGSAALVAVLGAIAALAVARGSGALALSSLGLGLAICGVLYVAGMVAACVGQPWHVIYSLLPVGVVGAIGLGLYRRRIRRLGPDATSRQAAADA